MTSLKIFLKNKNLEKINTTLFYQTIAFSLSLLLLKTLNTTNYSSLIITSLFEFFFLFSLYLIYSLSKQIKNRLLKKIFTISLLINYIFSIFFFFISTFYFDEYNLMKYSLSNIELEYLLFFTTEILTLKLGLSIFLSISLIIFLGIIFEKKLEKHFSKLIKYSLILSLISTIPIYVFSNSINNVYVNSFNELNSNTIIDLSQNSSIIENNSKFKTNFSNQIQNYSTLDNKTNHIYLFVMEQISFNKFQNELNNLNPENNFFKLVENHTISYENHYTTNQDSRTSVWTMTNSQFIPHEAYLYNWEKYYGHILKEKNLINLFNKNNYLTQNFVSHYGLGLILGIHNWDKVNYLKTFDKNNPNFFCFHKYEFEKSCEDKIILKKFQEQIIENKNKSFFYLQEFIYGHGEIFIETLKKSRTQYYNDYLFEIYKTIQSQNLTNQTTIILVADHGEKGHFSKQLSNYQVPLLVINPKKTKKKQVIKNLSSHLNIKDILLNSLNSNHKIQYPNSIYFIGQTQSKEFGFITNQNKYSIYKQKSNNKFEIKYSNIQNLTIHKTILNSFQKYKQNFTQKSSTGNYWCELCKINENK